VLSEQPAKTAFVLINLGTPDEPDAESIRRYLRQFLSDPRVVDLPRWLWLPILNLFILRTRPARLVKKYQLIWGTRDGPIRNITRALGRRVQQRFEEGADDSHVEVAMTYGKPSISQALDKLEQMGIQRIVFLPLFPQHAGSTLGAVKDEIERQLTGRQNRWQYTTVDDYHQHPSYIRAVADSIRRAKAFRDWKRDWKRDGSDGGNGNVNSRVVFSFHGIPKLHVDRGDPYQVQCHATAGLIASELGITNWMITFQSRFGPAPWLQPYTDKTMAQLPGEGITDVLIVCPGFSVDCLETIEEIKLLNRNIFIAAGGNRYSYVKALNASWDHVDALVQIAQDHLSEIAHPANDQ
jgi:ferrochelatase